MGEERAYIHDRFLDADERYEIFSVKAAERPHLLQWRHACDDDPTRSSCGAADGARRGPQLSWTCVEDGGGDREEKKDESNDGAMEDGVNVDARGVENEKKDEPTSPSSLLAEPSPPPLTDGCDLPGWRAERIAPCMESEIAGRLDPPDDSSLFGGTLNVGAGSTLFRRESQFPFVCSGTVSPLQRSSSDHTSATRSNNPPRYWCWKTAKIKFLVPPPSERAVNVVSHEEAAASVEFVDERSKEKRLRKVTAFSMEYEYRNRPVKITGATRDWEAMPRYDNAKDHFHATNAVGGSNFKKESDADSDGILTEGIWVDLGMKSSVLCGAGKGGWTFANLVSRFGDVRFRFSDQHGEMLSLNTYAKYLMDPEGLSDDSPLGIYDSEFGDDSPTNVLLSEYTIPRCFSPDLFGLTDDEDREHEVGTTNGIRVGDDVADSCCDESFVTGESSSGQYEPKNPRPPYRWVLIGPERSGTGMHVDPLWTNAWVTVLQGLKRWLLFPPETPHDSIGMVGDQPQIPSSIWFRDYYDAVTSPTTWPEKYRPVEVLQHPGETVFVPAGWPHIVLNLELTVAVTHNYASEFGPFNRIWEEVAKDEPEFGKRWYLGLVKHGREDLASSAPSEIST